MAPTYGYKEIRMKFAVIDLTTGIMNPDDKRQNLFCTDVSALWALVTSRQLFLAIKLIASFTYQIQSAREINFGIPRLVQVKEKTL